MTKNLKDITDFSKYDCLPSIFTSWFWRFYDNLFHLVLINFCWFSTFAGTIWVFWRLGLLVDANGLSIIGFCSCFIMGIVVSVGWAFIVFKIFNNEEWTATDYWIGIKKYGGKAIAVSVISGIVIFLVYFNLHFYLRNQPRFIDFVMSGLVFWIGLIGVLTALYQWPLLFFQDSSLTSIFYRSTVLVFSNGLQALFLLVFFLFCAGFFSILVAPWIFVGMVFFFSLQCVALEKALLRYKITFRGKPIEPFLETLELEHKRSWKDFLKPWENR